MNVTLLTPRSTSNTAKLLLTNRRPARELDISPEVLDRLNGLTGLAFSNDGANGHISLNGEGVVFRPFDKSMTLSRVPNVHPNYFPPNTRYIIFGSVVNEVTLVSIVITERQDDGGFHIVYSFTESPDLLDPLNLRIISILRENEIQPTTPSPMLSSNTEATTEHDDEAVAAEKKRKGYIRFIEEFDNISRGKIPSDTDTAEQYFQSVEIPPESYSPGVRDRIITFCLKNPPEFFSKAFGLNRSLIDDDSFHRLRFSIFAASDGDLNSDFFVSLARNRSFLKHPSVAIILDSAETYHPNTRFSEEFLIQLEELGKLKNLDLEEARTLNLDALNIKLRTEILNEGFKEENHGNEVFFELGKKTNLLTSGNIDDAMEEAKAFPNCTLSKGLGLNHGLLGKALNKTKKVLLELWAKEHTDTELGESLLALFSSEEGIKALNRKKYASM